MDLASQIEKLKALHESGALTDEEFAFAKQRLLAPEPHPLPRPETHVYRQPEPDQSFGRAANRYVSLQIAMALVGAVISLIVLFKVILPGFRHVGMGVGF